MKPRPEPAASDGALEPLGAVTRPIPERRVLNLLVTLSADVDTAVRAGGLRGGLAPADVLVDPGTGDGTLCEWLSPRDPRRKMTEAPEVAAGTEPSPRSVVFALGCIAFRAATARDFSRAVGERPGAGLVPLRSLRYSKRSTRLIESLLAADPRGRPSSARAVRKGAKRILDRTRWEGDSVAPRAPRRPIPILPLVPVLMAATLFVLLRLDVGPFQMERLRAGVRLVKAFFSSEEAADPSSAAPERLGKEAAVAGDGSAARANGGPAAARVDEAAGRQKAPPEKTWPPASFREGERLLADARTRMSASRGREPVDAYAELTEALSLLAEARAEFQKSGEDFPDHASSVDAKVVEVNADVAACKSLLPAIPPQPQPAPRKD